ncbi:hypothetical protein LV161_000331 [Aspergillus fumigatus]|nr:hypothetical protein LV161_000331 [Aspergillus fumigatus]
MRVPPNLRPISRWVSNMQWLLLAVFIPCVFSFPFEFPSDLETSYVTGANQTLVERNHLYKRAADYSSIVTWGYECNEDRIKYLSEELDETKTLLRNARAKIGTLKDLFTNKVQPTDWGMYYKEYYIILDVWQAYFGKILLHKDIGGRNRRTFQQAISTMNTVSSMYSTILNALGGSGGWIMTLNCNDEYYKNIGKSVDANGNAIIKYEDTREDGIKGETAEMPAEFGMCYEKTELNGWSFFNQLTNKQEMAISPAALDRYRTKNKLSDIENTEAALKGKSLTGLKLRAAATTILHEMTHFYSLFGAGKTALLLGVANAATLAKRWSNGDVATGTTDPNVASGCTYWANSIASSDTCESLNAYFGITIAQLVSWNPSLSSTSCTLTVGWSYCVEAPTVKTTTSTTTTTSKTTTTTTVVTTTTSTSDYCEGIVTAYGNFTLSQFYQWNPAVKTDCSGLQAGYFVCIGVAGSTTTTTSNPHSPQQTGIAANCNKYYFVEIGDGCAAIASTYGITLADFYSWNPAVGTSCQSLQAGYYVCVGVSAQSGDICLVQEILQQLSVITKKREETASTEDSPIRDTQDNTDEEDGARDWDGTLHWDLQQHPLYKEWYRVRDILFVQRAFLASISPGRKELVQCFLDSGAVAGFAFPANEKHPLPLSLAIRHGHEEIFDILVKHKARACGEDECPVVAAVKYHRFHELRVLVRLGDCGHWDEALSLALDTRPISDHMVDNGVEIKKYGHVALFGAITEGKKDWVEFLISQGADPNLCLSTESDIGGGEKKYSSIYHAILNGHLDVCKFLIEHGVQPEEDDLQLAREKEYDEIVGILSGFSYVDVPEKEDLITRWRNTHS